MTPRSESVVPYSIGAPHTFIGSFFGLLGVARVSSGGPAVWQLSLAVAVVEGWT